MNTEEWAVFVVSPDTKGSSFSDNRREPGGHQATIDKQRKQGLYPTIDVAIANGILV